MSGPFDLLRAVRELKIPPPPPVLNATDKLVLLALVMRADANGASFPSHMRIAHDTWLSRRQVQRSLVKLQAAGIVDTRQRNVTDGGKERETNVYTVKIEVVTNGRQVATTSHHVVTDSRGGGDQESPGVVTNGQGGGDPRSQEVPNEGSRGSTQGRTFALTGDPTSGVDGAKKKSRAKREATPEHRDLVAHFVGLYEHARGCKPEIAAKDHVAANRLLANGRTLDDARAILDRAFADPFVAEKKPDLSYIAANVNAYIGTAPVKVDARRAVQPAPAGRSAWEAGS